MTRGPRTSEFANPARQAGTSDRSAALHALSFALFPLLAISLVHLFMSLVAKAVPWNPANPRKWIVADAVHYLSIARDGYWLNSSDVGNTAWFPGYSLLIRALSPNPVWDAAVALSISNFCCLLCLYLMWYSLRTVELRKSVLTLVAFAFAPGSIFLHAISPTALLLLIAMLLQIALLKRSWAWAILLVAAGSFVYSSGFMLAAVAGLWLLLERDIKWRTRILVATAMGLCACTAVLTVFAMQDTQSGVAHAFFARQSEFGNRGMSNPLLTVWRYVAYGLYHPGLIAQVPIFTVAIATALAIACLRRWNGSERLTVIYCAVMWFFPLSVGTSATPWRTGVTPWRPMALCSPIVSLLKKTPIWAICAVIAIELVFAALAVIRFGQGRLV